MNGSSTVVANAIRTSNSVVACSRLAAFLGQHLGAEVLDSADVTLKRDRYQTLIIVNSPWGFCTEEHRARIRRILWQAKRVIWAQQEIDGGIGPRSFKSMGAWLDGESEAGVRPGRDGRRRLDLWTNIPLFVERGFISQSIYVSSRSAYVNWNVLHYAPENRPRDVDQRSKSNRLFYFGAFRPDRAARFEKYLRPDLYPVTVSTAVGRSVERFKTLLGDAVEVVPRSVGLIDQLARERAVVYIEDERTTETYNSPAARFYEALSARTCQLIDADAVANLERAGFSVSPAWVVRDAGDVARKLPFAHRFGEDQALRWSTPKIRREFNNQLRGALSK